MQDDYASAFLQEAIKLFVAFLVPIVIPEIENDDIRQIPVGLLRPFPGGRDANCRRFFEKIFPTSLPCGVIMLARPVILRPSHEDDIQRSKSVLISRLLLFDIGFSAQNRFHFGLSSKRRRDLLPILSRRRGILGRRIG